MNLGVNIKWLAGLFIVSTMVSFASNNKPVYDKMAVEDKDMTTKDTQTKNFEHHVYPVGDTLNCLGIKPLGYNDYHGCKISVIYNFVDSCYIEMGDEKGINIYHLAILSPDYDNGKRWELFGDRLLLIKKGEDTFIYDNVISNEKITDVSADPYLRIDNSLIVPCESVIVPCENFFIPSDDENNGTFNQSCDFELAYIGGQGYKVGWNIAIRIREDKLYIVGLCVWEHNSDLTYTKRIAFEYDEGTFPLEKFDRSMIEMVRNDKNPRPSELYE